MSTPLSSKSPQIHKCWRHYLSKKIWILFFFQYMILEGMAPYGRLHLAPVEGWWPLATWRALWIAVLAENTAVRTEQTSLQTWDEKMWWRKEGGKKGREGDQLGFGVLIQIQQIFTILRCHHMLDLNTCCERMVGGGESPPPPGITPPPPMFAVPKRSIEGNLHVFIKSTCSKKCSRLSHAMVRAKLRLFFLIIRSFLSSRNILSKFIPDTGCPTSWPVETARRDEHSFLRKHGKLSDPLEKLSNVRNL